MRAEATGASIRATATRAAVRFSYISHTNTLKHRAELDAMLFIGRAPKFHRFESHQLFFEIIATAVSPLPWGVSLIVSPSPSSAH